MISVTRALGYYSTVAPTCLPFELPSPHLYLLLCFLLGLTVTKPYFGPSILPSARVPIFSHPAVEDDWHVLLLSLPLCFLGYRCLPGFLYECWAVNSGPLACTASTLLNEPLSGPKYEQ